MSFGLFHGIMATRSAGRSGRGKRTAVDSGIDTAQNEINLASTSRSAYDLALPENWSVQKLKYELHRIGITPDRRVSKRGLIKLFHESSHVRTNSASSDTRSTVDLQAAAVSTNDVTAQTGAQSSVAKRGRTLPTSAHAQETPGDQIESRNLQDTVNALQSTVSTLVENFDKMSQKVTQNTASSISDQSQVVRYSRSGHSQSSSDVNLAGGEWSQNQPEGNLFTANNNNNNRNEFREIICYQM